VIVVAAFNTLLMVLMVRNIMRVRVDPCDQLTVPSFIWMICYFMAVVFMVLEIVSRFGLPLVGWQTVDAFIVMIVSTMTLTVLDRRLRKMVNRAHGSIIKLTITDTGKQGPDIDLTTSTPVVPHPPTRS
jgi:hypothetical protein